MVENGPALADFMLAVEGLAILRKWGEPEASETIVARRREIATFLDQSEAPIWTPFRFQEFDVERGYAEFAKFYDEIGNVLIETETPLVRTALRDIAPGHAVDAACGTGRHSVLLEEPGWDIVGIDQSREMMAKAVAKLPDGRFARGRLESLPLRSGAVDLALCALALTHVPDPTGIIRELARLVRAQGRVVVSDIHPFFVGLGFHAFFGHGRFIRNYMHTHSTYFAAFASAGLRVVACLESTWSPESIASQDWAKPMQAAALDALAGLPLVLVWVAEPISDRRTRAD